MAVHARFAFPAGTHQTQKETTTGGGKQAANVDTSANKSAVRRIEHGERGAPKGGVFHHRLHLSLGRRRDDNVDGETSKAHLGQDETISID